MAVAVTQLDIDEVLRYMGCPPEQADPATRALAEEAGRQMLATVRPRWASRLCAVEERETGLLLDGRILLPGHDLKAHLAGCEQAVLFCATLGAEVDRLIRRSQSVDMARALALDACAAAAVETLCDQIELEVQASFPGCFFPYRFSPGYGDLPIEVQNDLLELLDAPRRVGLCTTASHILTPRKSVTALIGISKTLPQQSARSCLGCPGYNSCQYRKTGGHCGIS